MGLRRSLLLVATALFLPAYGLGLDRVGHGRPGHPAPAWSALPFVGFLLSIALFPLVAPRFWHHHYPKVAAAWAIALLVPFVIAYRGVAMHEVLHVAIIDYIPFIILLAALFTIGGGIFMRGSLRGSPPSNTAIMVIGTLHRVVDRHDRRRDAADSTVAARQRGAPHKAHTVVFFIFLVANIGGALTPLGDPPLFLGFLRRVRLLDLVALSRVLLVVGLVLSSTWRRLRPLESRGSALRDHGSVAREPLRVEGLAQVLLPRRRAPRSSPRRPGIWARSRSSACTSRSRT